ncbi:MAG: glycosyltransferase family 2 protein [Eubacteriales bacterium]|nr:glycosyltransferase family 2 protein [Eubacteriales bacterium]
MKLLSIAIPAYNSEDYLARCLDSVSVEVDERLDLIIVDDGSKDRTAEIAAEYVERYPQIFRYVKKENGGHGSAVNRGLQEAVGLWYYVLDSDDRLDFDNLKRVLNRLERFVAEGTVYDLYLVNYIYDKIGEKPKAISYADHLPVSEGFNWTSMRRLGTATFLTMHSMIYRSDLLRSIDFELPEHCFYVDNLLAYQPLTSVRSIFYDDLDLYYYFIGRDDQSVSMENLIKRIDQQIRVTKLMVESEDPYAEAIHRKLRAYMLSYVSMMMTICTVHLRMTGKEEDKQKARELWSWLKSKNRRIYRYCVMHPLSSPYIMSAMSAKTIRTGYKFAQKVFKFN